MSGIDSSKQRPKNVPAVSSMLTPISLYEPRERSRNHCIPWQKRLRPKGPRDLNKETQAISTLHNNLLHHHKTRAPGICWITEGFWGVLTKDSTGAILENSHMSYVRVRQKDLYKILQNKTVDQLYSDAAYSKP